MRRPWVCCSRPSSSFSSPAMTLSSDDLPVPLRPIRPTRSPASSDSDGAVEQGDVAEGEVGVGKGKDGHGRKAAPARRTRLSAQASARSSASTNIAATSKPRLLGDLLEAGRARDVDLGEAVADDVEADQQQAARRQRRPDRLGDLAVARRERLGDALAADGEVAADLAALRDARQRVRHRHAVDDEDALVAGRDLGEVALRHHRRRAVAVERLGDAAEVEAVGADAKDAHAAHAVERLEDDVAGARRGSA